jgi:hypothetical protein
MKRIISSVAFLCLVACSGGDFAGGSASKQDKGKKSNVDNKADPTKDKTGVDPNDPSKTPGGPSNDEKINQAKQNLVKLGFVANDKVYVPVGSTVTIPVAVAGCKIDQATIAKCGPDQKGVQGISVGEVPGEIQTDKGPMKITVVVYDPKNPNDGVLNGAQQQAQAQVGATTDGSQGGIPGVDDSGGSKTTVPGQADVTDGSIAKPDPAYGGVYRTRVAFGDGFVNPYTNGLGCPAGYSDQLVHEMTDATRRFYCNSANNQPCAISAHACYRLDKQDNTAGFFRTSAGAPGSIVNNPYTNAQSCPAGYNVVGLMEFFSQGGEFYSNGIQDGLVEVKYCARPALGDGTSGGFYRKDNKDGGERCPSPNPYTGQCSCPAGFQTQQFHEFTAPGYYDGWSVGLYACWRT